MLIILSFSSCDGGDITFSFQYEEQIQGFLYNIIEDPVFARFLHDIGYKCNNRSYKMFSFSKILEKAKFVDKSQRKFIFGNEISIAISTIENEFFNSIFQTILHNKGELFIGSNKLNLISIKSNIFEICDFHIIKTLSPICCYSTATMMDGKKRTIYYNPKEREFSKLVRNNLIHKYEALYGKKPEDDSFYIFPKGITKEKVNTFKGIIIKGYSGVFEIKGSKELIKLAFTAGLGSKNAAGFGCIYPINVDIK